MKVSDEQLEDIGKPHEDAAWVGMGALGSWRGGSRNRNPISRRQGDPVPMQKQLSWETGLAKDKHFRRASFPTAAHIQV